MFEKKSYGAIDKTGSKVINLGLPQNLDDAVNIQYITDLMSQNDFQENVQGIQVDATFVPQKLDSIRYIVTDVTKLHADFGTITGVENNDVVAYIGGKFSQ